MNTEKIIVFDFDGVIADSFHIAFEVNQLQRPSITEERYRNMFNMNIGDAKHTDPVVNEIDFFEEYGKRFETLGVDDAVKQVLKELSETYPLYIISSSTNALIDEYLVRHGMREYFQEILGYDVEKSKVKKFKMLFEHEAYSPEETAFLTDSSGDVNESKEAGVALIVGILGGYQFRETLEASEPHAIVDDMPAFKELIDERFA